MRPAVSDASTGVHVGATPTIDDDSALLPPARGATKLLRHESPAMKRFLKTIACSSLILGAQTLSAKPESPAVVARQQLSECMTKRMAANHGLSYNEAMRACKERLQPPKDLAANNSIEADTKGH